MKNFEMVPVSFKPSRADLLLLAAISERLQMGKSAVIRFAIACLAAHLDLPPINELRATVAREPDPGENYAKT